MSEEKVHSDEERTAGDDATTRGDDAAAHQRQAELQEKLHDMGVMPRPDEMPEITPRRLTRTLAAGVVLLALTIAGIYWWHERGETSGTEAAADATQGTPPATGLETSSHMAAPPVEPWQASSPAPVAGPPAAAGPARVPASPPVNGVETPSSGNDTATLPPNIPPRWAPPPAWGRPAPAYGWQPPPPGWFAPSPYPGWGPYGNYQPPPRISR